MNKGAMPSLALLSMKEMMHLISMLRFKSTKSLFFDTFPSSSSYVFAVNAKEKIVPLQEKFLPVSQLKILV
jgi:hypothetical protein